MFLSVLPLLLHISTVEGFGCYTCASPDSHLPAHQLLHLRSQIDIFFYSDKFSPSCNHNLSSHEVADLEVEVCDEINRCATLSPVFNLSPNETVIHRGCFGSLLRHKFRDRKFVHQEGCYLLRSIPLYDVEQPVDYVVCVCEGEKNISISLSRYSLNVFTLLKLRRKETVGGIAMPS
ncbi:hot-6 [Pristionchus pacificus]|nr:hot-6 [Pristionchus pacificus]